MRHALLVLLALASVGPVAVACDPVSPRPLDAGPVDGGADASRSGADAAQDAPPSEDDAPSVGEDAPGPTTDDATVMDAVFPRALGCTARTLATVTVVNTGTSTWTAAARYGLEPTGADPLHPTGARVVLPDGVSVAPGESHEFLAPLAATGAAGHFTTSWRMTRDGGAPFGATASQELDVYCDVTTVDAFDLAAVTIVSSPDVRSFAVTSRLTSLAFAPGTIAIDHSLRGTWPPVVIADDGTTQEATIWVFFHIGGQWYATGGERLRPDQTTKDLSEPSAIGRGWLYDPGRWGVMTGYVPSPGDLVGFMVVAGSTRSDDHVIVRERSNVVLVPFPEDGVPTSFPPFAWEE